MTTGAVSVAPGFGGMALSLPPDPPQQGAGPEATGLVEGLDGAAGVTAVTPPTSSR